MDTLPVIGPHEDPAARRAFVLHDRLWLSNRYVYPVVSRRSKGISLGINLNPDKICNFDCIYCSVDRTIAPETTRVDLGLLRTELGAMLELAASGSIYSFDPFDTIPPGLRRINDIAFSGDGEPTTFPEFHAACRLAVELKQAAGMAAVKIVVISNATMFHRPQVQEALAFLDQHQGEVWGKLDAGTEAYYRHIDASSIPFQRVLENLLRCARQRPLVVQSLFMNVQGQGPSEAEIEAYVQRLAEIINGGGQLKMVQVYTVARRTAQAHVMPLAAAALEAIGRVITGRLPALPVEIYP